MANLGRFSKNPQLDPVATPLSNGIAWAAGIYEGEGCTVKHHKNNKTGYVTVRIAQKDSWLIYRFQKWFGGSAHSYLAKGGKVGFKNGPRQYFLWTVTGDRANNFLSLVYPLLSPRRQLQIDIARS